MPVEISDEDRVVLEDAESFLRNGIGFLEDLAERGVVSSELAAKFDAVYTELCARIDEIDGEDEDEGAEEEEEESSDESESE